MVSASSSVPNRLAWPPISSHLKEHAPSSALKTTQWENSLWINTDLQEKDELRKTLNGLHHQSVKGYAVNAWCLLFLMMERKKNPNSDEKQGRERQQSSNFNMESWTVSERLVEVSIILLILHFSARRLWQSLDYTVSGSRYSSELSSRFQSRDVSLSICGV